MPYLSIRNLPAHLERRIVAEARRRHTTKSAIVIECIEKATAPEKPKPSLRAWAGKLSRADYAAVVQASVDQRKIDPELWR
jgi:hypothetical protein